MLRNSPTRSEVTTGIDKQLLQRCVVLKIGRNGTVTTVNLTGADLSIGTEMGIEAQIGTEHAVPA